MIKNVIFDWSGVIKDAFDSHVWVVNRMMESLGGKAISKEELAANWDPSYMNFWKRYYPNLTLKQEQKLYYETVLKDGFPKSDAYEGIVGLIKKLEKAGVTMIVLTSDPHEILLPEIERFGLAGIFKEIIAKIPDKAEVMDGLIKKHQFNLEETVFIGDSGHEIEVGKQSGVKTIAVTWGFCTEEKLKAIKPDYLVHSIKELEKILL